MKYRLLDICEFVSDKVDVYNITTNNYISTENMIANKSGVTVAEKIPSIKRVNSFQHKDVLISNIRPYLKKVWAANRNGGCSADVFVFRAKKLSPSFLHYVMANDTFINYVMTGAKGVKMPRGDKQQILKYTLAVLMAEEQHKICHLMTLLDERISTQNKIIEDFKKLKSAIVEKILFSICEAPSIFLGSIAYITNGNGDVQDANLTKQEGWYPFFDRSEEIKWFPSYSFDKEAIIYAGEGQSFSPRYYKGKFALHQRCYAIIDFDKRALPRYCYHYMNTMNSYFVKKAVGSTVPSLRMDTFEKAKIRVPSLVEQKRICTIIDSLCSKIELEYSLLYQIESLKSYLLQQMFI